MTDEQHYIDQRQPGWREENSLKPFPVGRFVRITSERIPGRYMIVTVNGFVVGRRLDRGVGNYPECKTRGLTFDEAQSSCAVWEKFCEQNVRTRK